MKNKKLKAFGDSLRANDFRITLCDQNLEIAETLAEAFSEIEEVEVMQGNILNIWADAIVSPANSFGDMSGGLDKIIDDFYKGKAQKQLQTKINEDYLGELPVGQAITLKMDSLQFPNIIVAPTMRIPGNVKGTLNAYLAMRAILVELIRLNKKGNENIRNIVVPSLCTGVGRVPYKEAAEQMLTAYKNIMLSGWMEIKHPAMAPYALRKQSIID
ncbi:macro domain-containing protein [Flexithrix dorotheae]|uniref:macro domain-containing protein n=1 Tax=Flexithrix dorotheae TaxID=70993 RepID=UPI0003A6B148|nr:macro domain-containing protein [Flexithrix dorotheae]